MKNYPSVLLENKALENLKEYWIDGWFDQFSKEHFIIRAIEGKLNDYEWEEQIKNNSNYNYSMFSSFDGKIDSYSFLLNLNFRLKFMCDIFGKNKIEKFVKNQLSAGKENYNEQQFFQALSEISILCYLGSFENEYTSYQYEPQLNQDSNKNPEARYVFKDGAIIDVEVKTAQFNKSVINIPVFLPPLYLYDNELNLIRILCKSIKFELILPRLHKLKSFINSACEKFQYPSNDNHYNILFINWSDSDFPSNSFLEPATILMNEKRGLWKNKELGIRFGIKPEAYDKISVIFVYTQAMTDLIFTDFTYLGEHRMYYICNHKTLNNDLENICMKWREYPNKLPYLGMFSFNSASKLEYLHFEVLYEELINHIYEFK